STWSTGPLNLVEHVTSLVEPELAVAPIVMAARRRRTCHAVRVHLWIEQLQLAIMPSTKQTHAQAQMSDVAPRALGGLLKSCPLQPGIVWAAAICCVE